MSMNTLAWLRGQCIFDGCADSPEPCAPCAAAAELETLRTAANLLADDVERSAQSFRRPDQDSWPGEWEAEDPEGFAAWRGVRDALRRGSSRSSVESPESNREG